MDDADIDSAELADVPAAEADDTDDEGSWPVLSELDLAVCITASTLAQAAGIGARSTNQPT